MPRYTYYPRDGLVSIDPDSLRYWRDYYLFTREELAADAGVSKWTLQSWELGRRSPETAHFAKLLRALGIPAEELMLKGTRYREPEPQEDDRDF